MTPKKNGRFRFSWFQRSTHNAEAARKRRPRLQAAQAIRPGIVTLNERDILLPGKHNSAASKAEYRRLISEWIADDRRPPVEPQDVTINELLKQ